jgi:hypothetical protein
MTNSPRRSEPYRGQLLPSNFLRDSVPKFTTSQRNLVSPYTSSVLFFFVLACLKAPARHHPSRASSPHPFGTFLEDSHSQCISKSTSQNSRSSSPNADTKMTIQEQTSIHPPTVPHTHTIILLHGRSSTASTFHSELFESQNSSDAFFASLFPSVKWVFPCAPQRYSNIEQESTNQWFDMATVQRPWEQVEMQKEGLEESAEWLVKVVEKECREVGWRNVIVGGLVRGVRWGCICY